MIYTVRKATIDDINIVKKNSTEEGKVDKGVIERSEEMRCFLCDDEPLMVLGLVDYPTGSDEKAVALWGIISKDINKHTKYLVKTCKDLLLDRLGYTFVCYIDEESWTFKRFATFFGFKPTKYVEDLNGKLYRFYIKRN